MERGVLLASACVAAAGGLVTLVLLLWWAARRDGAVWSAGALPAAVLTPLILIAAALAVGPEQGRAWAAGLAIGAVGALLSAAGSVRCARATTPPLSGAAGSCAGQFTAVAMVAAVLLWGGDRVELLVALGAGWSIVAVVLVAGLCSAAPRSGDLARDASIAQLAGAGFAVTLAATAALGVYRATAVEGLRWAAASVALGAAVPVGVLLGASSAGALASARLLWLPLRAAGVVPAAIVLATASDLGIRNTLLQFRDLAALGLALGAVAWWLSASAGTGGGQETAATAQDGRFITAAGVLVTLGAFMAGWYLLAGYGVGVMLLAAWAIFDIAGARLLPDDGTSPPARQVRLLPAAGVLSGFAVLGVILLLFRLITTRFEDDLRGVGLTDHFALVGFLAGAAIPALLAGFARPSAPGRALGRTARLLATVALLLGVPGIMMVLWGSKVALALAAGLALSVAAYDLSGIRDPQGRDRPDAATAARLEDEWAPARWLPALYALAAAAAVAAWMHPVVQLASQPRAARVRLLGWSLVVLILATAASDLVPRFAAWRARRRGPGRRVPAVGAP